MSSAAAHARARSAWSLVLVPRRLAPARQARRASSSPSAPRSRDARGRRLLVRTGLPRQAHRLRRGLRHARADRRAPHAAARHPGRGAQPRERAHPGRADQRPRAARRGRIIDLSLGAAEALGIDRHRHGARPSHGDRLDPSPSRYWVQVGSFQRGEERASAPGRARAALPGNRRSDAESGWFQVRVPVGREAPQAAEASAPRLQRERASRPVLVRQPRSKT